MSMMEVDTTKIRTRLEHLTAVRNHVALRYAENQCSLLYWEQVFRLAKPDTQERVDASKNVETQADSVRKDKLYLECIDKLLKGENANPAV